MNKNLLLWTIIIALVIGAGTGIFFLGRASKVCDTVSVAPIIIPDTNKAPVILQIKKVPYYKEVSLRQLDSIGADIKKWWIENVPKDTVYKDKPQTFGLFTASRDTVTSDSTLEAHTEVRSRIPLDPLLKFYNRYKVKKTVITKEVEKPKGFFDRFGHGISVGIGYGAFHKVMDTWLGYGFYFSL